LAPVLAAAQLCLPLGWLAACGPGAPEEPEPAAPIQEPPLIEGLSEVYHVVGGDETFGEICSQKHGIPYADMLAMVAVAEEQVEQDLTAIRAGRTLQMRFDSTDTLVDLAYPLNSAEDSWVVLHREADGTYSATLEEVEYDVEMRTLTTEITPKSNSFWLACERLEGGGLDGNAILALAEIFEYDIDFATEVQQGDRIAIWVEALSVNGNFKKYGIVHAARYLNAEGPHEAIRFTPTDDKPAYFTAEGMSTKKQFLRSPLKFSRVASGFSRSRFHPVLKKNRPHLGTDFSAPTGTPVRALGDGKVTHAGWRGGYGNLVIIQHDSKYSTRYGHFSKYGKGIKKGKRVEQGQIIGYVGATGLATGPHLHFEFRINGNPVNFMKQDFPNSEPISKTDMPRFNEEKAPLLAQLDTVLPVPVAEAPDEAP